MQITSYTGLAVALINTLGRQSTTVGSSDRRGDRLQTVADLRTLLVDEPVWRRIAGEEDLEPLRVLRHELRTVFEDAGLGEESSAAQRINRLLERALVTPSLTGHDGTAWHVHLADRAATATEGVTAAAVLGLAFYAAEHGFRRFGTCHATSCPHVFLDSSDNRSRRYCSDRCASRANVAAFRARRRPPLASTAAGPRLRTLRERTEPAPRDGT